MRAPDPEHPKLTRNDQEVLKSIITAAKIPDSDIARKMGLSPQAIFKIRRKLEETGIIKGYEPVIDYRKLGIKAFVLLIVRMKDEVWEDHSEEEVAEQLRKVPYIISAYRVLEAEATHALVMAFRDVEQLTRYVSRLQTRFHRKIEIRRVYHFPADRIITESPVGLLYEILDKEEHPLDDSFLRKLK